MHLGLSQRPTSVTSRIASHLHASTSAPCPLIATRRRVAQLPSTRRCWRSRCQASSDGSAEEELGEPKESPEERPEVVSEVVPEVLSEPAQPSASDAPSSSTALATVDEQDATPLQTWLYPEASELPEDFEMPIWDHLDELRERVLVAALAALTGVLGCFVFSKDLVVFLEAPVASMGVRFLQLSPGEFFFTTLQVAGYAGLLLATPTVLYQVIAYVVPGLTRSERRLLAPVVFGSSILFFVGLLFAYEILTPAALKFFVEYAEGAVESLWSIDQYFQFVLVLLLSTGLSFQVPVIQVLLGQFGLVTSEQMFSQWKFVVVGATVVAAVLTPSTDPFTQTLLAVPLIGLYLGGAAAVKLIEGTKVEGA